MNDRSMVLHDAWIFERSETELRMYEAKLKVNASSGGCSRSLRFCRVNARTLHRLLFTPMVWSSNPDIDSQVQSS